MEGKTESIIISCNHLFLVPSSLLILSVFFWLDLVVICLLSAFIMLFYVWRYLFGFVWVVETIPRLVLVCSVQKYPRFSFQSISQLLPCVRSYVFLLGFMHVPAPFYLVSACTSNASYTPRYCRVPRRMTAVSTLSDQLRSTRYNHFPVTTIL